MGDPAGELRLDGIVWNKRDRSVFDLYRVSLSTHERTRIAENPGDVMECLTDWEDRPRARIRRVSPDSRALEVLREGHWFRDYWGYSSTAGMSVIVTETRVMRPGPGRFS